MENIRLSALLASEDHKTSKEEQTTSVIMSSFVAFCILAIPQCKLSASLEILTKFNA